MDGPLRDVDEMDQTAAMIGMSAVPDRAMVLARRYEAACERKFKWAADLLKKKHKPAAKALRHRHHRAGLRNPIRWRSRKGRWSISTP